MKKNYSKLSIILVALAFTLSLQAQPALDPTFSGNGYVLSKINNANTDIARTVLIQSNGKILAGGNSINSSGFSDAAIVRLKTNGAYDNNFGTAGIATIPGAFFCDMALLPNNNVIVAGGGTSAANFNNYIVYRLQSNGSIDPTFGSNGKVTINMNGGNMICFDMALQQDGKIVLGGYIDNGGGGHHQLLIIRLNKNGKLDPTFANNGKFKLDLPNKDVECHQLAIQPDGKIVAGGMMDTVLFFYSFRYDFAAVRLNQNGTLDASFGDGGMVRADQGNTDISHAIGLLSDGRIILAGMSDEPGNTQFAVLCLMPDGSPDNSFGLNGWKFINFYGGSAICNALAIESDDDIVLAGDVTFLGVGLSKLQSTGALDGTFGDGGIDTSFTNAGGFLECNDVALQSDNKIVITGLHPKGNNDAFLTARYTNSTLRISEEQDLQNDAAYLNVYPNPITENAVMIQYSLTQNSDVNFQLFDAEGRMRGAWNEGVQVQGAHMLEFSLAGLEVGNYMMVLNTETRRQVFKIQKAN